MEVDHVPYIFGSFSRRRSSQDPKTKRKSIDNTPNTSNSPKKDEFQRTRSFSKPFLELFHKKETEEEFFRRKSVVRLALDDTSPIFGTLPALPTSIRKNAGSVKKDFRTTFEECVEIFPKENEFECFWCKKIYTEPRVLDCLHSFCTKCLLDIENDAVFDGPKDLRQNSVGSELISFRKKKLTCPICDTNTFIPLGIYGLPHNYILQHKLVLASLNQEDTKLLCDLCTEEHIATHRCIECLINLCPACTEKHATNFTTKSHELLGLKDRAITKITRQIMCSVHKENELNLFCSTCSQVTCVECMATMHLHHVGETPLRACNTRKIGIKDALERIISYSDRAELLNERVTNNKKTWINQCNSVELEIEKFIEEYKKSIDQHKENLLDQVRGVKNEQLKILNNHQKMLEKQISEATNIIKFTDDILKEGTEIEILTFVDTILKKMQYISGAEDILQPPKITESVQFLENEIENLDNKFKIYGVISTQKVSLDNCTIRTEGAGLDNLRVHRKANIILETKDSGENPLAHGGLKIGAELWYRDAGMTVRTLNVHISDNKDGTYGIIFIPDTPGKLSLGVTISGQHIKDSPFPITVRNIRPHRGVYHCCSFCSHSSGPCGCGGHMPGYKGCGHGHDGHPGRRHWSCCGNVLENSECRRQSMGVAHFM